VSGDYLVHVLKGSYLVEDRRNQDLRNRIVSNQMLQREAASDWGGSEGETQFGCQRRAPRRPNPRHRSLPLVPCLAGWCGLEGGHNEKASSKVHNEGSNESV
jgi:hypothetical protein